MTGVECMIYTIQMIAIFFTWVSYQMWSLDRDIARLEHENQCIEWFNNEGADYTELDQFLNIRGIDIDE